MIYKLKNSSDINIFQADLNNDKIVHSISLLMQKWSAKMGHEADYEDIFADLKKHNDPTGIVIIAAENSGKVLGIIAATCLYRYWIKKKILTENYFFVDPEQQNNGLGVCLIKEFKRIARERGLDGVQICPNKYGSINPDSVKSVLEKHDFKFHGYMMEWRV